MILGQVVDFLGVPDDVPGGIARRMQRQRVLYDGEHHYDVALGEQALCTNIGGPEVMRQRIERLLRDLGPASLTLGILPSTARVDLFPVHGFNIYGDGDRAHVELVSSAVDVGERSELALYDTAFAAPSSAASYGDAAEALLGKARSFPVDAPLGE
ncbi:Scr1 family TA system antitoxin-like transcriptional regulator [Streptomyces sp. NPDC000609]|uniref:Scr1 family TA system antitoxin-like transcriptional regulator n=1 Tax=Streptomyces sp. NPDC000609 TaxID=3160957 RepID=UPI0033954662